MWGRTEIRDHSTPRAHRDQQRGCAVPTRPSSRRTCIPRPRPFPRPAPPSIYPNRQKHLDPQAPATVESTYELAEDPLIWYSGGQYHVLYDYPDDRVGYHLTSIDGVHDWTDRGLAYDPRYAQQIFGYTDGTVDHWFKMERPNVVLENGHVTYMTFAVSDVDKNDQIPAGSDHGSKVIVVPFDGAQLDCDIGIDGCDAVSEGGSASGFAGGRDGGAPDAGVAEGGADGSGGQSGSGSGNGIGSNAGSSSGGGGSGSGTGTNVGSTSDASSGGRGCGCTVGERMPFAQRTCALFTLLGALLWAKRKRKVQ